MMSIQNKINKMCSKQTNFIQNVYFKTDHSIKRLGEDWKRISGESGRAMWEKVNKFVTKGTFFWSNCCKCFFYKGNLVVEYKPYYRIYITEAIIEDGLILLKPWFVDSADTYRHKAGVYLSSKEKWIVIDYTNRRLYNTKGEELKLTYSFDGLEHWRSSVKNYLSYRITTCVAQSQLCDIFKTSNAASLVEEITKTGKRYSFAIDDSDCIDISFYGKGKWWICSNVPCFYFKMSYADTEYFIKFEKRIPSCYQRKSSNPDSWRITRAFNEIEWKECAVPCLKLAKEETRASLINWFKSFYLSSYLNLVEYIKTEEQKGQQENSEDLILRFIFLIARSKAKEFLMSGGLFNIFNSLRDCRTLFSKDEIKKITFRKWKLMNEYWDKVFSQCRRSYEDERVRLLDVLDMEDVRKQCTQDLDSFLGYTACAWRWYQIESSSPSNDDIHLLFKTIGENIKQCADSGIVNIWLDILDLLYSMKEKFASIWDDEHKSDADRRSWRENREMCQNWACTQMKEYFKMVYRIPKDKSPEGLHDSLVELHNELDNRATAARDERLRAELEERQKKNKKTIAQREKWEISKEKFLIKLPRTMTEVVEEGRALHHCVGGYAERHIVGDTTILFLREQSNPDKPLFTIEVRDNEIVQIHGFANCWLGTYPTEDIIQFVADWINDNSLVCSQTILLSTSQGYCSNGHFKETNIDFSKYPTIHN